MNFGHGYFPKAAAEIAALSTLGPLVVGARMSGLWLSAMGVGTSKPDEAERMVWEKFQAACESALAMNVAVGTAFASAATGAALGAPRTLFDADAVLSAGLRPYSDRVRANRRRLSRKA